MAITVTNITKLRTGSAASISGAITDMAANSMMACIAATYEGAGGNHQASDSENLAYSTVASRSITQGSTDAGISLHYFQNTVAGSGSSGNASGGTGAAAITAIFYEVAGISTTTAHVAGESGGSTGASSSPNSSQVINSVADSIILAGMTNLDGGATALYGINLTGTVGTYSENTSSGRELAGNSFQVLGTVYQVVAAGSSQRHVWQSTNGAGAQTWATVIGAFAGAGGAAPAAVVRKYRALMGVGR